MYAGITYENRTPVSHTKFQNRTPVSHTNPLYLEKISEVSLNPAHEKCGISSCSGRISLIHRALYMEISKDSAFPVDGQLLRVLPRAGSSLRNPNVRPPVLGSNMEGYYLEISIEPESSDPNEVILTRRIPLDHLSEKELEELKQEYAKLALNLKDLKSFMDQGLANSLADVQGRDVQRIFTTLLTFLNVRQVAILLDLYREAARQGNGREVRFQSNDLLERLGYKRTDKGPFSARVRSQLHRDLFALHRTELVFASPFKNGQKVGADIDVKSILRIKRFKVDNLPRDFDSTRAADRSFEAADEYTVHLEFFDGPSGIGDYVLFPNTIDIKQDQTNNSRKEYKLRLLMYLASRMKWDKTHQYKGCLIISKQFLFKHLDLLGRNNSRNNEILWRTIEDLKQEGYVLQAQELPGKKKSLNIEFHINPEKIRWENPVT